MPVTQNCNSRCKGRPLRNITMKEFMSSLVGCIIAITACNSAPAFADQSRDPQSDCYWGAAGSGIKSFRADVGTVYIPRDAKVGSAIGTIDLSSRIHDPTGLEVRCMNDGSVLLEFEAQATAPIFPGPLDPVDGEDLTGKVLQTNIPGVGARIKLGIPFDGRSANSFHPVGGFPTVPFQGLNDHRQMLSPLTFGPMNSRITLVKTGTIATGPNLLDGSELFSGSVTTLGRVLSYGLTGTVITAQCTVGGNPVSADPVQLGEWESADFTGPGFTTTAVPFSITLSNCATDTTTPGFVATANIQLDGVRGSVPVAPTTSGVFSLTTDSTAQGMGIQILQADGVTPMELQAEVPLIAIAPGNTVLNFNARFYQTAASNAIRPGIAKGALSFTLTYK